MNSLYENEASDTHDDDDDDYAGQIKGEEELLDIFFSLIARYASTHLYTYSYCARVWTMYRLEYGRMVGY